MSTTLERFFNKVQKSDEPNGCWLWVGAKSDTGYGQFAAEKRLVRAHRFAYEALVGQIPKGLFVCHSCDVRHCVNPHHLWLGTNTDNVRDMLRKGRCGVSKLTEAFVMELRQRYADGNITQTALAQEFGISATHVHAIVRNKTWKHLRERQ